MLIFIVGYLCALKSAMYIDMQIHTTNTNAEINKTHKTTI